MFHLMRRSPDSESSPRAPQLQVPIRRFSWIVATILGGLLVVSVALFPVQAAASSFQDGARSSTTNPPLLKVVPTYVNPDYTNYYCKVQKTGPNSVCHVTLTERINSSHSLHWFTRSDIPVKITPSSGNLSPGQSVQVLITVNVRTCIGYPNVYFVGPKNVVTVMLLCD